ncbi:MAG: hypothetical protein ACRCYV_03540 [Aeromonas sp.]
MSEQAADIGRLTGSAAELKALARSDAARRQQAKPRILNVKDLQGDYDAGRLLTTTLGGQTRAVAADDLAAFRQNARALGRRFTGGITARQVIDMSLTIDRKRAREEISVAVPASARTVRHSGGSMDALDVRFVTNASRKYAATRHHVTVQFLAFSTAVNSGALSPAKAALQLKKAGVRFDCDCGRHTFWYRYIASVGNYNAGRAENGYPKVRNPNLAGVACKHVLRVMAEIEGSGVVSAFLTKAITKARDSDAGRSNVRTSDKQAEKLAQKQAARPKASGANTGDRDYERARQALRQQSRRTTTAPRKVAAGSKRVKALSGEQGAQKALLTMIKQLGITPEQAMAILQGMK